MKKIIFLSLSVLFLSIGIIPNTSFAEDNIGVDVTKYFNPFSSFENPYTFEFLKPNSRSAKNNDYSKTTIDFSEAIFLDEDGNKLDTLAIVNSMRPTLTRAHTSGGTWTSGSGYSVVKGMTINHTTALTKLTYKADFQLVQNGYDKIDKIYQVSPGSWGGTISVVAEGIFRMYEKYGYSAYGGAKIQLNLAAGLGGSTTNGCYLRVAKDTYWLDVF